MSSRTPEPQLRTLRTQRTGRAGTADAWIARTDPAQLDVPRAAVPWLRRLPEGDGLPESGDIVILHTPVAFRWPHFAYAIARA